MSSMTNWVSFCSKVFNSPQVGRRFLAPSHIAAFSRPSTRLAQRQKGARRPLRIPFLEAPEAEVEEDAVRLSFALPSGAYATVALREILGKEA